MRRPPRAPGRAILDRRILALMALGGIWSAATTLGVFVTARWRGTPLQEAMTLTFVTLVLIQFAKAYVFRSERHAITRAPFANKWLNRAVLWEVCLLALLVYVPGLQALFGTHALGPGEVLVTVAAALSVVPVLETAKWLGRKRAGQVPGAATA